MMSTYFTLLLLCARSLAFSFDDRQPPSPRSIWRPDSRSVPSNGYYDPQAAGGSMLTQVPGTDPTGLGEPINVIISGNSDADVLQDNQNGGLRTYFLSFQFATECLGQDIGSDQAANLGDGNGYKNETAVMRYDYSDPTSGSCKETIQGGNHFRYWVQNGASADSGAIFIAASYEFPLAQEHDIIPNGYNLGRDWLVGNITNSSVPTLSLTNTTTYSGTTSFGGYTYQTGIQYVGGLLANSSIGVNHNVTVGVNGSPAVDGLVAVMTVKITEKPTNASTKSSGGSRPTPLETWHLPTFFALLTISCT